MILPGWRRLLLGIVLAVAHLGASMWLWFVAYRLFHIHVAQDSPAFQMPSWSALFFFVPVAFIFGCISRVWNRIGSVVSALPWLTAHFLVLGGMTASAYHQVTLWDSIGRPSAAAITVGLVSGAAVAFGWHLGALSIRHLRGHAGARA
jgi:hypothetical protein